MLVDRVFMGLEIYSDLFMDEIHLVFRLVHCVAGLVGCAFRGQ